MESVQMIYKNVWMVWKVSCRSKKGLNFVNIHFKKSMKCLSAHSFPFNCPPWSISMKYGPFLCLKSCKHTFYALFSLVWKYMRFTRFIRKVFATKILLFGMFLLFLTLRTLVSSIMSRIFGPKSFYSKFVQLFTREVIVTGLH